MGALPDLLDLTPEQLKSLFDQGRLGKHSYRYLEKINLFHPAIWGKAIGQDLNGNLVWLPQDTTGRMPTVEENSGDIETATTLVNYSLSKSDVQSWLMNELGMSYSSWLGLSGASIPIELSILDWTAMDGSGVLAATEIIPLVAGQKIAPELIHVNLSPDSARSGGSGQIVIKDGTTGTILGRGGINDANPHETIELCHAGASGENIVIEIAAGAVHLGAGKISVMAHWRSR